MKTYKMTSSRKKSRIRLLIPMTIALYGVFNTGTAPAAIVNGPLQGVVNPDINALGLLDKRGNNGNNTGNLTPAQAAQWPWDPITKADQRTALQAFGKAVFWDMQVGGDGVQACASCHFHAGADHRKTNQMSPGLLSLNNGDTGHDAFMPGPNGTLSNAHFLGQNQNGIQIGLPVSEAVLQTAGALPDLANGELAAGPHPFLNGDDGDVNDVISSQGVRLGTFVSLTDLSGGLFGRTDTANLASDDPGFNRTLGSFTTVRRVEPRNTPTVLNAGFNFRNFWDGRADAFFNGVNPFGFRDPVATVKRYTGQAIGDPIDVERLDLPFSSLASQAVGPVLSAFEMHWDARNFADVGKKMNHATPLAGQLVADDDSLLGIPALHLAGARGLRVEYGTWIKQIFDERFWGDGMGNDVCLDASDNVQECNGTEAYTLLEKNFSLFFGLGVQAYEAQLTTGLTIYDLIEGGIATGTVTNNTVRRPIVVNVGSTVVNGVRQFVTLQDCIARVRGANNAAQNAVATTLCTAHYAKFIHPGALSGSQSNQVDPAFALAPNTAIGGCLNRLGQLSTALQNGNCAGVLANTASTNNAAVPLPNPTTLSPFNANASRALLAIDRGLNRFFAGNTSCGVCHFNPEFTGATVSALTGFGAGPIPPVPPGQLRRLPPEVPMERMIAFNGAPAVYDSGFYNLGIRPTWNDLAIGENLGFPEGNIPKAFTRLSEIIQIVANGGTVPAGFDANRINLISANLANGNLLIPTAPNNLTPRPWTIGLACGPGLNGNGNGNGNQNNNPNANCVPNVIPGERLLRNGAFKASDLRNVKFTGGFFHNGAKKDLSEVFETYATAGHMTTLNFNNLDAGMRIINLAPTEQASVIEFMETGLTDWRVGYEEGLFDHPELCVPNGHFGSGETRLAGIPAVGIGGHQGQLLQTFQDQLNLDDTDDGLAQNLLTPCTVGDGSADDISLDNVTSDIDVPPAQPVGP